MGFLESFAEGMYDQLNYSYENYKKKIRQFLKGKSDDEIRRMLNNSNLNDAKMQFVVEEARRRGIY